jgi:hypothetical protein
MVFRVKYKIKTYVCRKHKFEDKTTQTRPRPQPVKRQLKWSIADKPSAIILRRNV